MRDKLVPIPAHLFGEVYEIGGRHSEVSKKVGFKGRWVGDNVTPEMFVLFVKPVDKCALFFELRRRIVPRLTYRIVSFGGNRGSLMEWVIESYDRRTDRDGQNRFTSDSAFISAAEELLRNIRKGFVSAKLPDGRVLDEAALRVLVARAAVNR